MSLEKLFSGTVALAVILFAIISLTVACGGAATSTEDSAGSTASGTTMKKDTTEADTIVTMQTTEKSTKTVSKERKVFFPQKKPADPDGLGASARLRGKLVVDEKGCLRIGPGRGRPGITPIWPSYYRLSTKGGEIRVLDGEGKFVARVGGRIDTGGGMARYPDTTAPLEGGRVVSKQVARKVSRRCPGRYFFINPPEEHRQ